MGFKTGPKELVAYYTQFGVTAVQDWCRLSV